MAEFDAETVDALNTLLEDERASVEMEVALASGASAYAERETLVAMGADDIGFCVALHEQLERAGALVTRRINGVVFQALGAERYDDRLLVFARHQLTINDRYRDLASRDLDDETRDLLQTLTAAHERQVVWLERRAQAFAATRQFDFRGGLGASGGSGVVAPVADVEQTPPRDESSVVDDDNDNDNDDPEGLDSAAPDGLAPDLRSAAPVRRTQRAPYTPGARRQSADDRRDGARYPAPSGDDYAADEGYTPYPAPPREAFDAAPPSIPPPVRRRYGAYRPGAPNPPYDTAAYAADAGEDEDGRRHPPNMPYTYTYAESDYPYDTPDAPSSPDGPGQAPYGPYPDDRDD